MAKVEKLLGVKKKKTALAGSPEGETNGLDGDTCTDKDVCKSPIISEKLVSNSVDVSCVDGNGSTPLILGAFHGHKEIVYTLLLYSADINAQDYQGNTALHMAAWQNRSDVVEVLVQNGADVNKKNMNGYTALHFASQYCAPGKLFTIARILQGNADVLIENKDGDTALDLAARFDKREVVSMFVDSTSDVLLSSHPLVMAAHAGRSEVVEILLDARMDPNLMDKKTQSYPIHEAVRFFRLKIAKLLLEFGASLDMTNVNQETPTSIALTLPEAKQLEFIQLFEDSRAWERRVPKVNLERSQSCEELESSAEVPTTSIVYPLLRNKKSWLRNTREHCSIVSDKNPCTNLLDGNLQSVWSVRSPGGEWVAFDLHSEYALNGVRIYGWGNKQMLRQFTMEMGESLSGPWTQVGKYCCDLHGSEDLEDAPVPQDIKGFYGCSRFWRFTACSNYGDPVTCFHGIQFFGIELGVLDWFQDLDAMKYCKMFVERGCNQLTDLATLTEEKVHELVVLPGHRKKLIISLKKLRNEVATITRLEWSRPPVNRIVVGSCLPSFSIRGDPYCTKRVKLIAHGNPVITGETVVDLVPQENGKPSKAYFKDICLSPAGKYCFEVQSEADPTVLVRATEPIVVAPAPKRGEELDKAFDDIQCLLSF